LCDNDGNIPVKIDAPSGKTFSFPKLMNSFIQIRAMVLVYSSNYGSLLSYHCNNLKADFVVGSDLTF
jgi:hypothetical protein